MYTDPHYRNIPSQHKTTYKLYTNNMNDVHVSDIEPSSVILSKTKHYRRFKIEMLCHKHGQLLCSQNATNQPKLTTCAIGCI